MLFGTDFSLLPWFGGPRPLFFWDGGDDGTESDSGGRLTDVHVVGLEAGGFSDAAGVTIDCCSLGCWVIEAAAADGDLTVPGALFQISAAERRAMRCSSRLVWTFVGKIGRAHV